ncbi:hypothetical protein SAY86_011970 [Trapa natans]|uniref:CSN8/PSMD8/EIF3K domain-containing protein n=1 Tax=Trapa natans TaxID=22666 RepID=A0AAN7LW01_TRANT|nr:hypothetical protein SAY86_011970 [Trapa natans]
MFGLRERLRDAVTSRSYTRIAYRFRRVEGRCHLSVLHKDRGCLRLSHAPGATLLGFCYRNGARFLWKTIPAAIKERQPETVAAWKIGQKLWTRDYAGVHEALRSLDWSREARDLVNSLSNVMQQGWLMDHITGMFTVKKLTVSKEQKVNFDNLQPLSTYSTWSTSTPLHLRGLSR